MLHARIPNKGSLAESKALVAQIVKSVPALAVVGRASTLIIISSDTGEHTPLVTVQRKVVDEPAVKLVTVVL